MNESTSLYSNQDQQSLQKLNDRKWIDVLASGKRIFKDWGSVPDDWKTEYMFWKLFRRKVHPGSDVVAFCAPPKAPNTYYELFDVKDTYEA